MPLAIAWYAHSTDYIEPYDFWWNVKSGEIMKQCGFPDLPNFNCFLATDVLVWTPVREPYSNPQWGSQLVFFGLYNASPYLLLTARAIIITGALAVLMLLIYQKSRSLRMTSLVALLAYFTGWTNYGMRPQLLAFLPFIGFYFLLENKETRWRSLPLLVPIMLFWVNVHGSFFLGVALLGIYALGTLLERLPNAAGREWLRSRAALWQFGWFGAAALATLANPYGAGIYNYFFVATNDPIARALNIEWQAPTLTDGTGILFFGNVLVFLLSAYLSKRRMRPTEILLVLAFGYLALTSIRNVLWWGWVTAPIIAANFAAFAANRAARKREAAIGHPETEAESQRPDVPALNWAIAVALMAGVLVFTPLWRAHNPLVPRANAGALSDDTPSKLAVYLESAKLPKPLFNYMEWGGYLEWILYPEYRMFIDGRFEARQVQVWKDYLSISRARADWQKTLDGYGVKTLVLNKDFHHDLIGFAQLSKDWRKVYEDKLGVVFVRR